MSDLTIDIKNFAQGVKYGTDATMIEDNALADAQNFLPNGAIGGIQKIKVWHKDLLAVDGTADDRIWASSPTIIADSAAMETADPLVPRFDNIEECFYFYSNSFDDGVTNLGLPDSTPNVPILVAGNNWTTYYTFFSPTGSASIKAGFFLYKDVVITTAKPLCISLPVRQNGTYDALTHLVTADLYYIDATQPGTTNQAEATVILGDLGLGRLEFQIAPTSSPATLSAGEYYVLITQATTTPTVDGYSFLGPITWTTGTNPAIFGWSINPTVYTGETVENADLTLTFFDQAQDAMTLASSYAFPTGTVAASKVYHGSITFYFTFTVNSRGRLYVSVNMDTEAVTLAASAAWASGTTYAENEFADDGGSPKRAYRSKASTNQNNLLSDTSWWEEVTVVTSFFATTGLLTELRISADESSAVVLTANTLTVDYFSQVPGSLAEMMVYQRSTLADEYIASADKLYKGFRYSEKNAEMPAGAIVRTDTELPIYAISDRHSFFMLYQTKVMGDAVADETVVNGAMFNSLDQYTRWRSSVGALSADRISYYMPKFIGQVNCFVNYQNKMVFGGVGGIAIFDPKNLLEGANKGKVNTPWRDVVIPNIERRTDSDYLELAAVTPTDVHPPVVNALIVYGDQPGRLIAFSEDYMFFQSSTTIQNNSKVWLWDALAVNQLGSGFGKVNTAIFFEGRALINSKQGELFSLSGVPPTDFSVDINTLTVQLERMIGVVSHWIDTKLGYIVGVFDDGTMFRMDGSLIPQPFATDITTTTNGQRVDIGVTGLSWDETKRQLWIHTDGFLSRSYMVSTTFTEVNVSARSYVWDADTDSFWPVVNPMDSETRTTLPSVFRDANISWSAGYRIALNATPVDEYVFTLECDIAGKDPLPIKNDDESIYQPENSTEHALETTAYITTKQFGTLDHASQVRSLQTLARLIDGTDASISLISEGVTTSLGAFSGSTTFALLAHKLAVKKLNAVPRANTFQIKITVANQYADILRSLLIKANLAGVVR